MTDKYQRQMILKGIFKVKQQKKELSHSRSRTLSCKYNVPKTTKSKIKINHENKFGLQKNQI